jgi:hypothetical protein
LVRWFLRAALLRMLLCVPGVAEGAAEDVDEALVDDQPHWCAPHVTLGQDYLPNRVSTASGVTLGLTVSIGGLATRL